MAAAHDLKLCGVIRVGSSPTPGTSIKLSGILPTNSAARNAAESIGKIPESLIVVRLFDEIRTYFERN